MRILRDAADVAALDDAELRALIERRLDEREIGEDFDAELHGPFVVMIPGDGLAEVEAAASDAASAAAAAAAAAAQHAEELRREIAALKAKLSETETAKAKADEDLAKLSALIPKHADPGDLSASGADKPKTVTMAEYSAMNPEARTKFAAEGGRIA